MLRSLVSRLSESWFIFWGALDEWRCHVKNYLYETYWLTRGRRLLLFVLIALAIALALAPEVVPH